MFFKKQVLTYMLIGALSSARQVTAINGIQENEKAKSLFQNMLPKLSTTKETLPTRHVVARNLSCEDATGKFKITGGGNKTCADANKAKCQNIPEFASNCPKTCGTPCNGGSPTKAPTTSSSCEDATGKFKITGGANKTCADANKAKCQNIPEFASNCPKTCGTPCNGGSPTKAPTTSSSCEDTPGKVKIKGLGKKLCKRLTESQCEKFASVTKKLCPFTCNSCHEPTVPPSKPPTPLPTDEPSSSPSTLPPTAEPTLPRYIW